MSQKIGYSSTRTLNVAATQAGGPSVEVLDRADGILQAMEKQEAAIAIDSHLSPLGKQEQTGKLAKEFHGKLSFVKGDATTRKSAAEQLQRTFAAVPKSQSNETVDFLISSEIRGRLAKLPMSERMKLLQDGNAQVLRAILTDPLNEALVDRTFLDRLQNDQAKATDNGKEWLRKESLVFVAERLDQLATAIDLQLLNYNTLPAFPGQPPRTTDLGYTDTQAPPPKGPADQPPSGQTTFQ